MVNIIPVLRVTLFLLIVGSYDLLVKSFQLVAWTSFHEMFTLFVEGYFNFFFFLEKKKKKKKKD